MDRRFGSDATIVPQTPPALTNLSADSDSLESYSPEPGPPASSKSKPLEDTFPVRHDYGIYAIVRNSEGSIDAVKEPPPAASHAFAVAFTNETLSPHIASARLTFLSRRRSDEQPARVIHNPVWLYNVGNTVAFGVHATHHLVLFIENRAELKRFFSVEDHRNTANATLGIEGRALEPVSTSMEVELTLDGSSTSLPRKRSISLQILRPSLSSQKRRLRQRRMMYKQKILHFFCRPCGAYHLKTHAHYRAMKRRKAKRKRETEAGAAEASRVQA